MDLFRGSPAMSLLDALSGLVRPARPAMADGPAQPTLAPSISVAPHPGASHAGGAAVLDAPDIADAGGAEDHEPSDREKTAMLHLSNVSHACNHFQNQMLTMLYPYIMAELGMSYMDLG